MAYLNPWDLLAKRASGSEGEDPDLLSRIALAQGAVSQMPFGGSVTLSKGSKKIPTPEEASQLFGLVGIDPEESKAMALANTEAMRNYEKAIATQAPQMDLSGLASLTQYYNQDKKLMPYEKPPEYSSQLMQGAKLQEAIGTIQQKDAERRAALLKTLGEYAQQEQGVKVDRKGQSAMSSGIPQQAAFDRELRTAALKWAEDKNKLQKDIGAIETALSSGDVAQLKMVGTKSARLLGETGVITDQDVARSTAGNLVKSMDQLQAWFESAPMEATAESMRSYKYMMQAMKELSNVALERKKNAIEAGFSSSAYWKPENKKALEGISGAMAEPKAPTENGPSLAESFAAYQKSKAPQAAPTPAPSPAQPVQKSESLADSFKAWQASKGKK